MSEHVEGMRSGARHIVRAQHVLAITIVVTVPSLTLDGLFLPLHSGPGLCHLTLKFLP